MKKQFLLIFIFQFFFIGTANAFWPFSVFNNLDYCANLTGTRWIGSGTASGLLNCSYEGTGVVVGSAPNYEIQIHILKHKGNFLCPQTFDITLNTQCINGKLTVNQKNITLKGYVKGNQMWMEGHISFLGVRDSVELSAWRQS